MKYNENLVVLIGHLANKTKIYGSGKVAKNSVWIKSGKTTKYIPITAFGEEADILQLAKEKDAVTVVGHLDVSVWEKDGKKRRDLVVVVDDIRVKEGNAFKQNAYDKGVEKLENVSKDEDVFF